MSIDREGSQSESTAGCEASATLQQLDDQSFEQLYAELRRFAAHLMRGQLAGATLQPTALVNEAFLKLVGIEPAGFRDRRHALNTYALAMRQILIDRARRKATPRHGGHRQRVSMEQLDGGGAASIPPDRIEDLEVAITQLEAHNPRWSEIVRLRFFSELTIEQTAEVMDISPALVKKDWRFARAWLGYAMNSDEHDLGEEERPA